MTVTNKYVDKFIIGDEEILIKDSETLDKLETHIEEVNAHNYIFISDSYANDTTRDGEMVTGWITRIISILGLTVNSNAFYEWNGGSGWLTAGGNGNDFNAHLNVVKSNMTEEQKAKTKTIVFCGGANDISQQASATQETWNAKVQTIANNCELNFPNANVLFVPIGFRHDTRSNRRRVKRIYQYLKNACATQSNITFIDGSYLPLFQRDNMCNDGIHPNNTGQKLITGNIVNAINGNTNNHFFALQDITITPRDIFKSTTPITAQMWFDDNILSFNIAWQNQQFELREPVSKTFNTSYTQLATYESNLLPSNAVIRIPCNCRTKESGGAYHTLDGFLEFADGQLRLYAIDLDEATTWRTYNIDRFQIDCVFHDVIMSNV